MGRKARDSTSRARLGKRFALNIQPMLETGQKAPEFTLPDQNGHDISLTGLLKDGPAILYFYPADFTPGCTREACSIRDIHREISRAGLTVAGISPQSPESHRRFREKHNLPFTLLSDETKEVIRMFGVNGPLGIWVQRVTYLIGQDRLINGRVKAHFSIAEHEAFIKKAIDLRKEDKVRA
jgi:thioredoxin-dependent peroxiredoxin